MSFVKDKVSIGAWIYLWAILVPLIYISVFVPVPYCLDDCGFVVEPEVRQVGSSGSILLFQYCRPPGSPIPGILQARMTSGSTKKPQLSRQYGTGTKTET